jgi:hypothetical protein
MSDLSTRVKEFAVGQKHEATRLRRRAADLAGEMPEQAARALAAGELAGLGAGANAAGARLITGEARAEVDRLLAGAAACEQRAQVAGRDPPAMLVRPAVEHRDADFINRWRSLIMDANRAGWVLEELPPELQPPPPPRLEPSPSAGWSADKKQLKVWREDYNRPGFAYSRDMLRAMETGAEVVVLD